MQTKRVWYSSNKNVNSSDSIHQILMFGTLREIKSLEEDLGRERLKELFLKYPKKIYTASAFNFIKNFVLGISVFIDEQKYLKYAPRHIG